ncbi:ribonucleoside-triphosphate reductase, adenosylcobalamin-dependent [Inquilinus limosus]|uniref:Adenosylcobalamin-dependent ribonucleoside-triphosphate reductase n=1 Tax=Inquilinus limosus MP06 TaxID=1398085 RepID=A0A0A0DDY6_9PROT|nr:ribonucleoside-triphosphate reductase, adenosylcobalamin-dependent [Inquilinus limosus]KGM36113.1 recombinase [Inquilinus limosus MP06]
MPSVRSNVVMRRTYNRPKNEEGTAFESLIETVIRVGRHQEWLWERAQGRPLSTDQYKELSDLMNLMMELKALPSGRTLWLGGTDVAKTREASQFNCAFARVETVQDVKDAFWLLLQGCGYGFEPITGNINGFARRHRVTIVPSAVTREMWDAGHRGGEHTLEQIHDDTWHIIVGDSAEGWVNAVGLLLTGKHNVGRLVLDFSQIRPAGIRLRGYGWISSGYGPFSEALEKIAEIMSHKRMQLLSRIDLLDILNLLGTTLSSRRSAEIALIPHGDPEWEEFAVAKKDHYEKGLKHRGQSNNTVLFFHKPSRAALVDFFRIMKEGGGSEPGIANAEAAKRRAPWFKGFNPCAEILLGNRSFCNLVENNLGAWNGDWEGLKRAHWLIARANYRQTCVNLLDGMLQSGWHELNEYLHLCGVGVTGIVRWEHHKSSAHRKDLRTIAQEGANSMADELGLPRPKAVTTIKPSGTLSKVMDTTEGVHRPLGRYILNNIKFSKHDPLVQMLAEAGYRVFDDPYTVDGVLVTFPVSYEDVEFDVVDGKEVNLESAVDQLDRYRDWMADYVDHNCSITISYSDDEVPAIIDWLLENWDSYVGVSFMYRNDPTKTAADLGYPYLPQEVVTKEVFEAYTSTLLPIDIDAGNSLFELDENGCSTGGCPVK